MKTDRVVLILISLILIAFVLGTYRVWDQTQVIERIIKAQSPLVFSFESETSGTTVVTCIKTNGNPYYICTTAQIKK